MPRDELFDLVRRIPRGRCATYGELGASLTSWVSGYMVGRWMTNCPEDVPWWRVVGKNGAILVGKKDPHLALEQRRRLENESVPFVDENVDIKACYFDPSAV